MTIQNKIPGEDCNLPRNQSPTNINNQLTFNPMITPINTALVSNNEHFNFLNGKQGFTVEEIEILKSKFGYQYWDAEKAQARGYYIKEPGVTHCRAGIYKPLSQSHGELRLLEPVKCRDNKTRKVARLSNTDLAEIGADQISWGIATEEGRGNIHPEGVVIWTEGMDDALMIHVREKIPTGFILGSGMWRDAPIETDDIVILDSDTVEKPQVWRQLVELGIAKGCKIAAFPQYERLKIGACEFYNDRTDENPAERVTLSDVLTTADTHLNWVKNVLVPYVVKKFPKSKESSRRELLTLLKIYYGTPDLRDVSAILIDANVATQKQIDYELDQIAKEKQQTAKKHYGNNATGFRTSVEEGLVYLQPTDEGVKEIPACSYIEVVSSTEDYRDGTVGLMLRMLNMERNQIRELQLPKPDLADITNITRFILANGGRPCLSKMKLIQEYLIGGYAPAPIRIDTNTTGWHGNSFVLPNKTLGNQELFFSGDKSSITQNGTLQEWKDNVGKYAKGNPILLLSTLIPFTSTLLEPLEEQNIGFHIYGSSSKGKTTALMFGASVLGKPEQVKMQWRFTVNGLELKAQSHSSLGMFIDEIGQANPKDAIASAYMLGNGEGKQRVTKNVELADKRKWKLSFFSTGEQDFVNFAKSSKENVRSGQEVRIVDIPLGDCKDGVFDDLHHFKNGAEFSRYLSQASARYYGSPIVHFLEYLTKRLEEDRDLFISQSLKLLEKHQQQLRYMCGENPDAMVVRVADKFAFLQMVGELAAFAGTIDLTPEEIANSISELFTRWLGARGGNRSRDDIECLDHIEGVLRANIGKFVNLDMVNPAELDIKQNEIYGFYKTVNGKPEFWVIPKAFTSVLCNGLNPTSVTSKLQAKNYIQTDSNGKSSIQKKVGRVNSRYYVIAPWWNDSEQIDEEVDLSEIGL